MWPFFWLRLQFQVGGVLVFCCCIACQETDVFVDQFVFANPVNDQYMILTGASWALVARTVLWVHGATYASFCAMVNKNCW